MSSPEEFLARYEQLIPPLHHTQMALWERVEESMMRTACGVIAHYTKCDFMPRDEDSIAMMLNYCCFNVFHPDGRNLVEMYVGERPPLDTDTYSVIQAHLESRYSIFALLETVPRIGARLRDLFSDEEILVVYPRLAETMAPGMVLPVRVMPLEQFHVLFNGPIPFSRPESVKEYEAYLFRTYGKHGVQKGRRLNADESGNIETFQTIHTLSKRYPELLPAHLRKPSAEPPADARTQERHSPGTMKSAGRNDPCPCGSGKKFKNCCLERN
jgi:hypothetical protein